jgi:hypothetical protein
VEWSQATDLSTQDFASSRRPIGAKKNVPHHLRLAAPYYTRLEIMRRRALRLIGEFLLFFTVAVVLQWRSGAMSAEFGGYPDESAHFVTALMVRDYLTTFPLQSPLPFAQNYYLHYPKVAFGHWPPFFHFAQAAWMLVFPVSRTSILLFMSVWTALLATGIRWTLGASVASLASWSAALLFLALPLTAQYTGMVMAEIPVAALTFAATVLFGRYLDSGNRREIFWFVVFGWLAILTKANAWALILMAIGAVLLSRRLGRLRSPWFWIPVLFAVSIGVLWTYLTLPMARLGWGPSPDWRTRWTALLTNALTIATAGGWAVTACACLGIWDRIGLPWFTEKRICGLWAACFTLLAGVVLFHSFLFCTTEPRHLISALPPWIMFHAAGLVFLARLVKLRSTRRRIESIVVGLVCAVFLIATFRIVRKPRYHFAQPVAAILARPETRNGAVLVSSNGSGEGPFIAEIAMHEPRPAYVVLRASKLLARSNWDGSDYRLRFREVKDILAYLDRVPVGIVVIDGVGGSAAPMHHRLLIESVALQPGEWEPLAIDVDSKNSILFFRRIGLEALTTRISLDPADLPPFSLSRK